VCIQIGSTGTFSGNVRQLVTGSGARTLQVWGGICMGQRRNQVLVTSPARHTFRRQPYPPVGGCLLLMAVLLVGCVPSPPSAPDVLHVAHMKALLGGALLPNSSLFAIGIITTAATNGQLVVLVGDGTGSGGLLVPIRGGKASAFSQGGAC
jgi:hypothetical protein